MRSFSFLIALLFAFVATSYAFPDFRLEARKGGNKNGTSNGNGNSVNKACKKMAKLTKLTELANNQTKLDAMVSKGKLNDTEVAEIKTKAQDASTQLQSMQANTTLVSECLVVDAHKKVVGQCKKMAKLTKLAAMKDNQTAIDAFAAKKNITGEKLTKLQDKIANATTKLQEMSGNTTLTDLCSKEQQQKGSSDGTSASSGGSSDGSSNTPEQSKTSGASGLGIQAMPYVFIPALGAIFAFFL